MPRHGGCACGALRFEARGDPYRVGLCHCLTCRKVHGAAFGAFAIYPVEAVTVTGLAATYRSSERGRRFFCRRCGSQVYARDVDADEIDIALGAFDDPDTSTPTYESYAAQRRSWFGSLRTLTQRYEGGRPVERRSEG